MGRRRFPSQHSRGKATRWNHSQLGGISPGRPNHHSLRTVPGLAPAHADVKLSRIRACLLRGGPFRLVYCYITTICLTDRYFICELAERMIGPAPSEKLAGCAHRNVNFVPVSVSRSRAEPWVGPGRGKPRPYIGNIKGESLAG
jgi:hypothetical protein